MLVDWESIDELNKNLMKADESSTELTKTINRLTLISVIISGIGLLVASCSLIWDIIKWLLS